MDNKEEELLQAQYKIEKTGIKQQKMEAQLSSLSKELKRSKRNNILFLLLFFAIFSMVGGVAYYFYQKETTKVVEVKAAEEKVSDDVKKMNDSLQGELTKLKTEITTFKSQLDSTIDSVDVVTKSIEKVAVAISEEETEEVPRGFEKRHCYVKRVFRQDDAVFIEADYVNYFEGKNAVEEAKLDGKAEIDITENGDSLYFLFKKYYVQNKKSKIRILELDESLRIQDVNQISNGFPLKAFQQIIKENPILVLEVKNGIVYKIKKQKLP